MILLAAEVPDGRPGKPNSIPPAHFPRGPQVVVMSVSLRRGRSALLSDSE